jgi:hypothetical protein
MQQRLEQLEQVLESRASASRLLSWTVSAATIALAVVGLAFGLYRITVATRTVERRDNTHDPRLGPAQPYALHGTHAEQTVELTFSATPARARFRIDEGPALANPYSAEVPVDDHEHVIEVTADGYIPHTATMRFAKDVVLDVALVPLRSPQAAAPARVPLPPPGAPAARPESPTREREPPPQGIRKQVLDPSDPWAK